MNHNVNATFPGTHVHAHVLAHAESRRTRISEREVRWSPSPSWPGRRALAAARPLLPLPARRCGCCHMHSVTRCWRRGSALAARSTGGASKRPPCGCSRRLASAATDQQAELFAVAHEIPPSHIRNFCIISHVDHGKSTLADRLMDMTGAVPSGKSRAQLLDSLEVERSRGITVKAQTVSLFHRDEASGELYLLNLIDTPGHVDFSYEVSRSIAACQGALLLVDCTKGVQARTAAAAITPRLAGRTAPTRYTRSFSPSPRRRRWPTSGSLSSRTSPSCLSSIRWTSATPTCRAPSRRWPRHSTPTRTRRSRYPPRPGSAPPACGRPCCWRHSALPWPPGAAPPEAGSCVAARCTRDEPLGRLICGRLNRPASTAPAPPPPRHACAAAARPEPRAAARRVGRGTAARAALRLMVRRPPLQPYVTEAATLCTRGCSPTRARGCSSYVCSSYVYQVRRLPWRAVPRAGA